jgi:hypothetical protein
MLIRFGKTLERQINPTDFGFPSESQLSPVAAHVIYIGIRNLGMDAHAGDTEEKHGADYIKFAGETLDKKLAALKSGEVRVAGTRESDPIRSQMRQLAVKAAYKKLGNKAESKDVTALVHKMFQNEAVEAKLRSVATKMVKAAQGLELDLEV